MRYLNPTFTLPAAPTGVSQEEWDRIFPPEPVASPEVLRSAGLPENWSGRVSVNPIPDTIEEYAANVRLALETSGTWTNDLIDPEQRTS